MPQALIDKQCAWCGQMWQTRKPNARTCSPRCRASLSQSEKRPDRPKPEPMQGFDFLDDADFVTTVEAASLLGVTRVTVSNWIDDGLLAASGRGQGRGRLIRVRVGDLRRLLARLEKRANERAAEGLSFTDTAATGDQQ